MKVFCIHILIGLLFFSNLLSAQNTHFLATTSIGVLSPIGQNDGIGKRGFTTITGVELNLHKNLWLTASADFQSIAYRKITANVDIDQSLNLIPILIGGRLLLPNKSKLTPYISASAGVTVLNTPKSEFVDGKTHVYNQRSLPFTYGFRGGIQYQIKAIFFPFIEIGYQSLKPEFSSKNVSFLPINLGLRTYPF